MKKIFLSVVFMVLLVNLTMAQFNEKINQVDTQNRKQGYWCKYYPNGKKAYEGWFKSNKPTGEFKRYHENGNIKAVLIYSDSPWVQTTIFNPKGQKIVSGYYVNQQRDSLWLYYDPEGKILLEERYKNGVKNGRTKSYYPSGNVMESAPYLNGQRHGVLVQFFENGSNKSVIHYENGTIHGPVKIYNANGTIRLEGVYNKGLKDGKWKYYSEEGKPLQTIKFINGVAENNDELVEKESRFLESLIRNIGKIKDPTIEDIMNQTGNGY